MGQENTTSIDRHPLGPCDGGAVAVAMFVLLSSADVSAHYNVITPDPLAVFGVLWQICCSLTASVITVKWQLLKIFKRLVFGFHVLVHVSSRLASTEMTCFTRLTRLTTFYNCRFGILEKFIVLLSTYW